jgi:polyisoprenoid-binding protein YceI
LRHTHFSCGDSRVDNRSCVAVLSISVSRLIDGWAIRGPIRWSSFAFAVLASGVTFDAPLAQAGRFDFDQRRTEVRFIYKIGFATQRGRFTSVSGTLDYDDAAPEKSKINATIGTASLSTGESYIDSELKGPAFFNVEVSPTIAFKSLSVRPLSAKGADVVGEITVNGITKSITLKVSLEPHNDPALKHDGGARKFSASTRIQRSAFNMTGYRSMVDDEIDIEIDAVVRPASRAVRWP